jgi:hypothetical protein
MFRLREMRFLDAMPAGMFTLGQARGWDRGATTTGDYTVGVKLVQLCGRAIDSTMWVIADVRRMREPPDAVRQLVHDVTKADGHSVEQ